MIFQLLTFCRRVTEYGSSAHHQVGTCIGQGFINYKIFLFPSQGGNYFGNILIKIITNIHGSFIHASSDFSKGAL